MRALAVLLLVAGSATAGENRLHVCEVELVGPLSHFELVLGENAKSTVQLELLAGERRTLRVPVAAVLPEALGGPAHWPLPEVRARAGTGSARPVRWSEDPGAADWDRVPPVLRLRNRPLVPGAVRLASPGALLLLAAGLALALGARRRPRMALVAGPALAAALLWLPAGTPRAEGVVVFEADGAALVALRVEGHRDWIAVGADGDTARLEVRPEGAAIDVELDGLVGASGPGRWVARAPGAELFAVSVLEGRGLAGVPLDPRSAAARWTRSAEGAQSGGGHWSGPAEPPPGWLVAGLPMGTGILLASGRGPAGGTFVRLTGWSDP
jgi:hypothetical protein